MYSIRQGEFTCHAEAEEKLPGKIMDKDLNFQSHWKSIIKTANEKLSALIRFSTFMTDFNKKAIFNCLLRASSVIFSYSGCLILHV